MHTTTPTINNILFLVCGFTFAVPALFFAYYTVRLIDVNLGATAEEAATHRSMGMLIGAIAFPVVTIVLGLISRFLSIRPGEDFREMAKFENQFCNRLEFFFAIFAALREKRDGPAKHPSPSGTGIYRDETFCPVIESTTYR